MAKRRKKTKPKASKKSAPKKMGGRKNDDFFDKFGKQFAVAVVVAAIACTWVIVEAKHGKGNFFAKLSQGFTMKKNKDSNRKTASKSSKKSKKH